MSKRGSKSLSMLLGEADGRFAISIGLARYVRLTLLLIGLLLSLLPALFLGTGEQRHGDQVVSSQTAALERSLRAGLDQRARVLARTAPRWKLNDRRERSDFDLEAAVNIES